MKTPKCLIKRKLRIDRATYAEEIFFEEDGKVVIQVTKGPLKGSCMKFESEVFKKFSLWFLYQTALEEK
mgnify:CR=1 FL=1